MPKSKWAKRLSVSIVMALALAISGITVYANFAPNMSYKVISYSGQDNSYLVIESSGAVNSNQWVDQYIISNPPVSPSTTAISSTSAWGLPDWTKILAVTLCSVFALVGIAFSLSAVLAGTFSIEWILLELLVWLIMVVVLLLA
jgi:hypothetical protein